uniref:Uncharacterized protein n=1 Tax=Anguilla anguilla TaxID=7936 RepID=A0A0E9VWA9_ANGAN
MWCQKFFSIFFFQFNTISLYIPSLSCVL